MPARPPTHGRADDTSPVAIELRGLTKTFPGNETPAVDGLDLEIRRGELVVFVGPSGCGKTTTLRMINRLEEPTSGQVRVDGRDVRDVPAHELRRGIGYVIQQVGLFPHRSVAQNISTVPMLLGWPKQRIRDRVAELAELVDLDPSLLGRYPAALSGGQQQRVGVARALAVDPPILLMDEPYSAVDPIVRAHLQDELLALHQRVGTTIVMVTHDIEEAIKVGDRVAVFAQGGRVAQYDTPSDLLARPADDFVTGFLGADRSLRRLQLVPLTDLNLHPADHDAGCSPLPTVEVTLSARQALDAMVAAGTDEAVVVDDGSTLGVVRMTELSVGDQ